MSENHDRMNHIYSIENAHPRKPLMVTMQQHLNSNNLCYHKTWPPVGAAAPPPARFCWIPDWLVPHASALNMWCCTSFAIWSIMTTHGLSMSCWHRKCPTEKNGRWSWSDWWCKAPKRAELVIWQIYWYHHLTIPILLCFSGAIATYVRKLLFPRNFIRTNWAKKAAIWKQEENHLKLQIDI